jgi:hypothetical protein
LEVGSVLAALVLGIGLLSSLLPVLVAKAGA